MDNYCKDKDLLFRQWKEKKSDYKQSKEVFVTDGVVCPEKWFSQSVRPLFLLKEAYTGNEDWDLIKDGILNKNEPIMPPVWKRVSQWTKGIMDTTEHDIPSFEEDLETRKRGNSYLKQCAVVNVKKIAGKSNSKMDIINDYAVRDRNELFEELKLCDPTVIICGYTISSLNLIFSKNNSYHDGPIKFYDTPNDNWFYYIKLNGHTVIVIDYYHPSNQFPDLMNYYGLLNIYQLAMKNIPDETDWL